MRYERDIDFADVTTPGNCPLEYSVTRTWTAVDDCGNQSQASQTINVQDITAPVTAPLPEPTTINCPAEPAFAVATATDACGSAFTLTSADVTTPGDSAGEYSVTRTWTATDACGNVSQCSQTVTVVDTTAPTITCVRPKTIECTVAWTFDAPSASDTCGTNRIDVVSTVTNGACGNTFSATRTWRATDACGNTSQCSRP